MAQKTQHYTNNKITVIWKPELCIHSGICFKGLPAVFDPRRKPWIILDNAANQLIVEQVKKCPSGALSFDIKEES